MISDPKSENVIELLALEYTLTISVVASVMPNERATESFAATGKSYAIYWLLASTAPAGRIAILTDFDPLVLLQMFSDEITADVLAGTV